MPKVGKIKISLAWQPTQVEEAKWQSCKDVKKISEPETEKPSPCSATSRCWHLSLLLRGLLSALWPWDLKQRPRRVFFDLFEMLVLPPLSMSMLISQMPPHLYRKVRCL